MKNILKVLIMFSIFSSVVYADNATNCITVGKDKRYKNSKANYKFLENRCSYDIYAFWCQSPNPKNKNHHCGTKKGKYYKTKKLIKAGKKKYNNYTLPLDINVQFGACPVTSNLKYKKSVKKFNTDGTYECATHIKSTGTIIESSNTIKFTCSNGKKEIYTLINKSTYQHPMVLKLKHNDTDTVVQINLNRKNEGLETLICKEPTDMNMRQNFLLGLKTYLRKNFKCDKKPKECEKLKKKITTFGDVRG